MPLIVTYWFVLQVVGAAVVMVTTPPDQEAVFTQLKGKDTWPPET